MMKPNVTSRWFVILAVLLVVVACRHQPASDTAGRQEPQEGDGGQGRHAEERIDLPPEAVETAGIRTAPATYAPLSEQIEATAVIKPNEYRLAHVNPRISGKAIEVKAELGDLVDAGTVLAELDSIELGEKKAAFLQARASLEVARRNYRREERLFKGHISSEKAYLEARGEFERSEAGHRAAREALRLVGLSDAEIEKVTWGGDDHPLSHFPLLAPFAGTVIERHMTIGELIEPDENPFTIADLRTVWIIVDIYEKDLARVALDTEVRVAVDAYPRRTFRGTITYVSHTLDPSTRTAQARVVIDNADGRLRPGMFARASIAMPPADQHPVLVVPADAIQQVRGEPVAFVEKAPGSYEMRHVQLGREAAGRVVVRSGVVEDERVVVAGAFYLKSTLLKEEMAGHGD
ncbi:MAG: efflux RND transporter periplasmic adaptor subunit [Candidatus Binatia bacterium]